MKDKRFLKWILIRLSLIIGLYLIVTTVLRLTLDHTLVSKCLNLTTMLNESAVSEPFELERLKIEMDREDLVMVDGPERSGEDVVWRFQPVGKARGEVFVQAVDPDTGFIAENAFLKVMPNGLIIDLNTGNFSHYRVHQLCMILLVFAVAGLCWAGLWKSVRELRYSYRSIFCAGLGLWSTLTAVLMTVRYAQNEIMLNLYNTLSGAAGAFTMYTFPLILVFAVLLTVSNISLIRHEGFRVANALGIIVSLIMIIGFLLLLFFNDLVTSGSDMEIKLWQTAVSILQTVYALLECFLIGSIICGTWAARAQPAFDKDYIVILGCRIRKDGTLYPLIRGRVDRAIRFYREQYQATGKKAILIPSGGQGSDEVISEGEAMHRYLLEQGIEPEQILPETRSVNTRQNMQFSMELMEPGKKAAFSTTNYHVFRSGIIAGQAGFEAEGMGSRTKWYFWPNAYTREVIGMLSYKWKALILLLIPIVAFLAVIRFMF